MSDNRRLVLIRSRNSIISQSICDSYVGDEAAPDDGNNVGETDEDKDHGVTFHDSSITSIIIDSLVSVASSSIFSCVRLTRCTASSDFDGFERVNHRVPKHRRFSRGVCPMRWRPSDCSHRKTWHLLLCGTGAGALLSNCFEANQMLKSY